MGQLFLLQKHQRVDERRTSVHGSRPTPAHTPCPASPERPVSWQLIGNPSSPFFNHDHTCANANEQLGIVHNIRVKDTYQDFGKLDASPRIAENATCEPTFRISQPFLQLLRLERAHRDLCKYFDNVKNSILYPQHLSHCLMLSRNIINIVGCSAAPVPSTSLMNLIGMLHHHDQDTCLQLKCWHPEKVK